MGFRVRGDAKAGRDCRLCGRPLMEHGITEFCREGRTYQGPPAKPIPHERPAAPKPRKPCLWPGCENTIPLNWWFCTSRDCQNARLWSRLFGGTPREEAVLAARAEYQDAQERKWRANRNVYMRHYKRAARERARLERQSEVA